MTAQQAITAIRERVKAWDYLYGPTYKDMETLLSHIDDQQAEIVRLRAALEAIIEPAYDCENIGIVMIAEEALAAGDGGCDGSV